VIKLRTGKVCVSVSAADAAEIADMVEPVTSCVDVIEVRLDSMKSPDVIGCCSRLQFPLLFTNRPIWEGGAFTGTEKERIEPLVAAVRLGAAYVDFEFLAEQDLREQLLAEVSQSSTQLILSWHNFEDTPGEEELIDLLVQMHSSGADIGKIITTAHDASDVLRVLSLQKKADAMQFPLSTFCMGECGRISRFATFYLGGYMTYVAISEAQVTAPGQFSVLHFNKLHSLFTDVN
jgi:3-dehydroquinate dehydratase-1/3-dehydroquinate dehydratase/shikimate dehydrogenase